MFLLSVVLVSGFLVVFVQQPKWHVMPFFIVL